MKRRRSPEAYFCACGDHAFAPLTKGFVALVSPEDAHVLAARCWRVHIGRNYVTVLSSNGGKFVLSRVIVGATGEVKVDHRDGVTVDNRRHNLRVCTHQQNMSNRRGIRGRSLPVGVTKERGRFRASITHDGQRIPLGAYASVEAASAAYRAVALALRGEFARIE